jgi:hypothetical protein
LAERAALGLAKTRRHLAVAVAGDGHTPPVFSAVRHDIFVEPQPKQNVSPIGAAYSEDVAPDGALAVNKLLFYKATVFSLQGKSLAF